MYFLGQAGNYNAKKILRHLFACGSSRDAERLKKHLALRYNTTTDRVFLYHTGRTALAAAIRALVPKGSEVVATSLTCYAVYEAIRAADCEPVFADVTTETLHYDGKTLEDALKKHPHVKAIIIQNNLGHPCDIESIERVAKKHHLVIIEDLAHCAGMYYKDGREMGDIGAAAALSFGKGKSVDTITGGALVLRDLSAKPPRQPKNLPKPSDRARDRFYPLFGAMIRGLYHFGSSGRYFTSLLLHLHWIRRSADEELSFTTRLTYWQARLALKQFDEMPEKRPPLRRYYLVDDREKCLDELAQHGFIMRDTWYDVPVSPERYYKRVGFSEKDCKNAAYIAKHIVNLPNHYPYSELREARNIISKYEIDDKDYNEERSKK